MNTLRMTFKTLVQSLTLVALLGGVSGCGAVFGAGAAVGMAAYDERGVDGVARDLRIHTRILEVWFQHEHTLPAKIGLEVHEGRALLTGTIPDAQVRADVVRLAWTVDGVKDVINEMQPIDQSTADFARDGWITTQLKSRITLDRDVLAVNYSVETVNGTVYLIGVAQSQSELDRVVAHARSLEYVRRVAPHVRVKGKT